MEQPLRQKDSEAMTTNSSENPAWNDILQALPEDLHTVVKPMLEQWDSTVQDKIQQVHKQYEPYKPLVEHEVDMDYIDQAIYIAQQLENNPQEVIDRAIEAFKLPYQKGEAVSINNGGAGDPNPFENTDLEDISQHPQFKAVMDQLGQLNSQFEKTQQETQAQQQQRQLEEYIEGLHKGPNGETVEFDDMYVAALISAGVKGEKAVEQFQQTVNQHAAKLAEAQQNPNSGGQQQQQQFTVLGGESGGGSGIPNNPPDFAHMKRNDLNDVVKQMLANSQNQQ